MSPAKNVVSNGGTLRIVLLVLGGLLLTGVLACAGIGILVYRTVVPAAQVAVQLLEDTADSHAVAQGFLEALREDRLGDAYGMTTDVFQGRLSRRDLEDFCRKNVGLREPGRIDEAKLTFSVENLHTRNFIYPLPDANGKPVAVQLTVLKEQDAFRIDDLNVVPLPQSAETSEPPRAPPLEAPTGAKDTSQQGTVSGRP